MERRLAPRAGAAPPAYHVAGAVCPAGKRAILHARGVAAALSGP
jgi:hypothetical protein